MIFAPTINFEKKNNKQGVCTSCTTITNFNSLSNYNVVARNQN